jgi:hypothetical protein
MDEHEGFLRIATTYTKPAADPEEPWRQETANRVSVIGEAASGQLELVGQTEELAVGERIQSARFVGDKGFVVTFVQIDPLFTIDLSQPSAPKVIGELKVPGFSTYIHPLDEDNLLTIGIHVPEPGSPEPVGMRHLKLTIFDVSDFADPREKFTELVGSSQAWSEATSEHKAFNYFADKKLLAIPFSDYAQTWSSEGEYWSSFVSELRVFDIDAAQGIALRGSVSFGEIYREGGVYDWAWYYTPWVRRSVMASDDADTYIYAISDAGIRVAEADALDAPLATVRFPTAEVTP